MSTRRPWTFQAPYGFAAATPEWAEVLQRDAPAYFAGGGGLAELRRFKGRIGQFSYLPAPGLPRLFVHRYHHGGLISFMGRFYIGRGRVDREVDVLERLQAAGIRVPRPAGGVARGRLLAELVLVTEEVEGGVTLHEWLRNPTRDGVRRVARAVRALAESGVAHADLNLRNILIRGEEVWFIDFDRAAMAASPRLVPRLYRSLEKWMDGEYSVSKSDRWRFLVEYAGGSRAARGIAPACASGLWIHRIRWKLFGK